MTIENRIVVGLDDIRALLIECKVCAGRTSYLPEKIRSIPGTCPQCKSEWRPREGYVQPASTSVFDNFVTGIHKAVEALKDEGVGFKMLFELDMPKILGSGVLS